MINEFRKFITRGNVLDLAVGIVIGAAFTGVVQSFVNDVLMPPIGLVLGGVDFSELYLHLGRGTFPTRAAAVEAGAPIISYGLFINNVIAFLITAFAVFLIIKAYERTRPPEAPPAAAEKQCPFCYSIIYLAAIRCPHCTSDLAGTAPI
jgi:large conductance mechanosensitive channel